MMRTSLIAGAFLLFCAAARAQPPEQLYQQGNLLYQQGNVEQAKETYESIVHEGYVSGELFYNLGNAYYKTGNIAKAILNYERALRLMPQDDDLRHNLQLANLMITDRIDPVPRLFIWDYWDDIKNAFSLRSITWVTYLGYLVVIGSLGLVVLARTYAMRKIGVIVTAAGVLVFAFVLMIFVGKISDARRTDEAIVMASIATVKNSPDPKSSDAFVLHSGIKVKVTDRVGEWIKVRLVDGKVGWLEAGDAELI